MKNPLIHLGVAAVVLLVSIGAYGVWFVAVDNENAKARELENEIHTKTQETSRIAAAKEALATLAIDEATVSQHFVSPTEIVSYLSGLESTGKALGSKVSVVSVASDQAAKGKQGHLNLSLTITGSFDSVMRTLGSFEYAPYDTMLNNATLSVGGSDSGKTWTASAQFVVGTGPVASSTPAVHPATAPVITTPATTAPATSATTSSVPASTQARSVTVITSTTSASAKP